MKNSIYNYDLKDIENYLISLGEKPFRGVQIFEWLYRHKINDFHQINNIKKTFLEVLNEKFVINRLEVVDIMQSTDVKKYLFRLEDGNLIETVLMVHDYGYSVCVTSQVGCNMGCGFCASGLKKKVRNLEVSEMVLQVFMISILENIRVSHVVVMGIGEPFDNYDNLIKFIKIINHPKGFEIGSRHISVSTCGIIDKIEKFSQENFQTNLAISLHASNNETRNKLMPINKTYDIDKLIIAIRNYISITNRRVTIEYILIDGINDSIKDANKLADLLHGLNVYVNIIPYNEVYENNYKKSPKEQTLKFYDVLKKRSINVTLRKEFGGNINAACGQLRSKFENDKLE